jgi:hypothetical protein
MRFRCHIARLDDSRWTATYRGTDVGPVQVVGSSRAEALEKIRNELRYRLELCPCSGETYRELTIDIEEAADGR